MCNNNICKTTDFIKRAIYVHGDLYDYSSVDYKNNKTKVIIICKKVSHIFEQQPTNHLNGNGCPKCAIRRGTTDTFIKKAIAVHGDAYDYIKSRYETNINKITIICKKANHEFEQSPNSHLRGSGCPQCSNKNRTKTTDQFIKSAIEVHGDLYDYSQVNYENSGKKITIFCKKSGHQFKQTPYTHLSGSGCPKCAIRRGTTDTFIKKAIAVHGDAYDYSKVNYKNSKTKVSKYHL